MELKRYMFSVIDILRSGGEVGGVVVIVVVVFVIVIVVLLKYIMLVVQCMESNNVF